MGQFIDDRSEDGIGEVDDVQLTCVGNKNVVAAQVTMNKNLFTIIMRLNVVQTFLPELRRNLSHRLYLPSSFTTSIPLKPSQGVFSLSVISRILCPKLTLSS